MACPHVSGLAAMLITLRCDLSGQEIRFLIENNVQVKPLYRDLVSSGGLIDVAKTIRALKKSGNKLTITKLTQYNKMFVAMFMSCTVAHASFFRWPEREALNGEELFVMYRRI